MKQYIMISKTLKMVDYCYSTYWWLMATHFHPYTEELAGPHVIRFTRLISNLLYKYSMVLTIHK